MKDYTHLYPGLTPRDAAIVYMHELHDRYMRRKPGVYDCGRPESEQENGCAGCNLRKLLGSVRRADRGGDRDTGDGAGRGGGGE